MRNAPISAVIDSLATPVTDGNGILHLILAKSAA